MNKSTPIVQLPSNQPQAPTFMNDQQRQYIAQAQQAVSNTTIPQNSQLSTDIVNDDDIVVQDILNQINNSTPNQNINATMPSYPMQQQAMFTNQQMMHPPSYPTQEIYTMQESNDYKTFYNQFAVDIKLASTVFFVVIIIHFVPLSSWMAKYIAVDKIPYHEIILRAILATLLVIIIKNLLKI